MRFPKLQFLWRETRNTDGLAEPSEARFRAWVLGLALLIGPPLILVLYYRMMFPGLTNADALDFAQIGRNLSVGHGFMTDILRPLALTHGSDPLHQPDVTHGPLFPFLLALAFGALGAKDSVVAGVSGLFYVLTIPVLYWLGVRVFNRAVGLLTAVIFIFNALALEYAASGLHITLYIFLMTSLMLVIYNLAAARRTTASAKGAPVPKMTLVLAGLLTGLLYLTDPIFFWIIPIILGAVLTLNRGAGRWQALPAFLLPLCLLVLPWMARNAVLTGNPVFGLRGLEIWMNTKTSYPGMIGYRMAPGEMVPSTDVFKSVVQKILLGIGQVIQTFPQVTASWVLAFFLPSLLFHFTDNAANVLRRVLMSCFGALLLGMLLFEIQMPLFVSLIPTMLVFSVAYLLHLIQQAQLSRTAVGLLATLLAVAVVFPLGSQMTLADKTPALKETKAAFALGQMTQPDEVILSDQPWIVAWFANRPSLWIPASDEQVGNYRQQFASTRWLFVTDEVTNCSPAWQYLHSAFQQWNLADAQSRMSRKPGPPALRIMGKGQPLFTALDGFVSVKPVEGAVLSTVIAAAPAAAPRLGQRPAPSGSPTLAADAAGPVPAR